jgi:hypothetical protein
MFYIDNISGPLERRLPGHRTRTRTRSGDGRSYIRPVIYPATSKIIIYQPNIGICASKGRRSFIKQ